MLAFCKSNKSELVVIDVSVCSITIDILSSRLLAQYKVKIKSENEIKRGY